MPERRCLGIEGEQQCAGCALYSPEAWRAESMMVAPMELRRGGLCRWRVPVLMCAEPMVLPALPR